MLEWFVIQKKKRKNTYLKKLIEGKEDEVGEQNNYC